MIGTRVEATLWAISYRIRKAPDGPYEIRERHVLTADPTGADLPDVAQSCVLRGRDGKGLDFALMSSHRVADKVDGLAVVARSDQTAPSKPAVDGILGGSSS